MKINDITTGNRHLIEANAGTGKTYAIANLCLRFILEGKKIGQLLVVTFTRDATDELRGRIRKRLYDARQMLRSKQVSDNEDEFFRGLLTLYPEGSERDGALQHLELALLDISSAPFFTIHGFCQQALTDEAFASGQTFELEQADDSVLIRSALRDWWRRKTYTLTPGELTVFQEQISGFEDFTELVKPLLKIPAPELSPTPPKNIEQLIKKLDDELNAMATIWQQQRETAKELLLSDTTGLNRNRHRIATLESFIDALDSALLHPPLCFPQQKELLAISHSRLTFKANTPEETKALFDIKVFTQPEQLLTRIEESKSKIITYEINNACSFVQQQLEEIKQDNGQLSFDDMISRLHNALNHGSAAKTLAKELAKDYPVILVDEFQDTDALQYAIFSKIHQADERHTLIMIGDPKQAIYGFRGGDIFTYIQARRDAEHRWSLSTNWRSTPEMINAVNTLFNSDNAFTFEDIPYEESNAAPDEQRKATQLVTNNAPQPALIFENLPLNENNTPQNVDNTREHVHLTVARRIADLLADNASQLGDKPLRPADIAILVRTGFEATAVREALLDCGIRAVTAGRDSIWNSEEAESLLILLEAALLPTDRKLLRQALSAPVLNLQVPELHKINKDNHYWAAWAELLHETGTIWRERGFMAGFQHLLNGFTSALPPVAGNDNEKSASWLNRLPDPERSLTNLLHLADLLQQASHEFPAGEPLLVWARRQQEVENPDEHELRLESDEELVKIVTIHRSKGLEFPVVFVPYLWSCRPANHKNNTSINWHEKNDSSFRHYYTPWKESDSPAMIHAEHERLAEDIRLAYVALTRAISYCHVFFGPAGSRDGHAGRTALAWLLSEKDTELNNTIFTVKPGNVSLESLRNKSDIAVLNPCQDNSPHRINLGTAPADILEPAKLERRLRLNWRIGSYSAMTRNVHQSTKVAPARDNMAFPLRYKAGAQIGSFLHALLEHINPGYPLRSQMKRLVPIFALRHGAGKKQDIDALTAWMDDILSTPLNNTDLTLASLDRSKVLHELEFDLGVSKVEHTRIDDLLRQNEDGRPPLDFETFEGMINGVIDMVFEHEGKYYVADYKSNLLGRNLEDYSQDKLAEDIANRRYDLQYLIYTLALHRHLRQRLANYNYQRDFGGVYYLFLRAMTPQTGTDYGVFFTKPTEELVTRLDDQIFAMHEKTSTEKQDIS